MNRSAIMFCVLSTATAATADSVQTLWAPAPAAKWTDAYPVGNGRMGAMVFGGVERERIQFNEETLWTGSPHSYVNKGATAHLPELRRLLLAGQQQKAEELGLAKFMSQPLHSAATSRLAM